MHFYEYFFNIDAKLLISTTILIYKNENLPAFIRKFGRCTRIFIAKNISLHDTSTEGHQFE